MKYCPRPGCGRPEDLAGPEHCGNFSMPCPPLVEFDPETMIYVKCGPCKKELVVPLDRIMKKSTKALADCKMDKCVARLVLPATEPKGKKLPPKLGE